MKHRVKFRIVQDSGSTGKIAITVLEGEYFPFTDTALGLEPSRGFVQTYFTLIVKNMTTVLHAIPGVTDLSVNGRTDIEFVVHPGDMISVAGRTIELIDVPIPTEAKEPDTQYLDITELRTPTATPAPEASGPPAEEADLELRAGRSLDAAHIAASIHADLKKSQETESTEHANQSAPFGGEELSGDLELPTAEVSSLDLEQVSGEHAAVETTLPLPSAEDISEEMNDEFSHEVSREIARHAAAHGEGLAADDAPEERTVEYDASRRAPPAHGEFDPKKLEQARRWKPDLDESGVTHKKDWKRTAGLGALAAVFVGALVFFFSFGSNTKTPNQARMPVSMPKVVVSEQAPPSNVVSGLPADDAQYTDLHKLIDSAYIKHQNRSIALENNAGTAQFTQQKIEFFSAVRYGQLATVKKMVESHVINPKTAMESDATALMQASSYNQVEIARYLLSKKVPINDADPFGATALMYAAKGNQIAVARFLLSKGADPMLRTHERRTRRAIDIAKDSHYSQMVDLLSRAMSGRKIASAAPSKKKSKKKRHY